MEPVLSEPEPVAALLRELRLRRLLGQHTGGHEHTVAGAGASGGRAAASTAPAVAPSTPLESCGAGDRVIPGLPPSPLPPEGFSLRAGQAFFSEFKQAAVTFPSSVSSLLSPLPAFLTNEASSPLVT